MEKSDAKNEAAPPRRGGEPPLDSDQSRHRALAHYATFHPDLQRAMKEASARQGWTKEQWIDEVVIVAELIAVNHYSAEYVDLLTKVYERMES